MNIRQLQIAYLPEQDRLLMRINTHDDAEVRLWLTRRFVRLLWPELVKVVERSALAGMALERPGAAALPVEARGMLADMKREAALSQADFKTPFQPKAATLPLGEEPMLVTRMDLTPQADGKTIVAMRQDEQRGIQLSMGEQLLHGFCTLLHKEAGKAGWDIVLPLGATLPASVPHNLN